MSKPVSMNQSASGNEGDEIYAAFVSRVNDRLQQSVADGLEPLFTTDTKTLWSTYLDALPTETRQRHTCQCCRNFIERFGGLVVIDSIGRTRSAIWNKDDAPDHYKPALAAMAKQMKGAAITGVFVSTDEILGKPQTGAWRHFSARLPAMMRFNRLAQTAAQARAEKSEDFKAVKYALDQFSLATLESALRLLRSDALYRNEKVLGPAEWLHALKTNCSRAKGEIKSNLIWQAIATAPAGFCHPRSSMIGTLLDDIASGMNFSEVSQRFARKMHPLQYQRPQAAPSEGTIKAAEKLVQQLGAAGALSRRFARLEEVRAIWKPTETKRSTSDGGIFSHLRTKSAKSSIAELKLPPQIMTWEKFQRTVLPAAEQIELFLPPGKGSYSSLITSVDPDAPPILQWDHENLRNPVSWYFWNGGSTPEQFGLSAGAFQKVVAITLKPSMWNGGYEHQGLGVMFVLDGAKDTRNPGACLFPEMLKAEFHGVRSVIEAFSKDAKLEAADQASAAGMMLLKGAVWTALVKVTTSGISQEYSLDRWD